MATESKKQNTSANESLPLIVARADGKTRERYWPECTIPSLKAALANVPAEQVNKGQKQEATMCLAIWAREGGQVS